MLSGKVVDEFEVEGFDDVVIRYPEMKDTRDLHKLVNSLVEEKAEVGWEEKKKSKNILMEWQKS